MDMRAFDAYTAERFMTSKREPIDKIASTDSF